MTDTDPAPSGAPDFASLGLDDAIVGGLARLGYEEPTPIQAEAIPVVLSGRDVLGQAATGTGKTASFALPIVQRIGPDAPRTPKALILVPTRELAVQVSEAVFKYGAPFRTAVLPVFGGQPIHRQLRELSRGVHVVVATPGRAIDHIDRGSLDLSGIEVVVLDEADEMLDMGFSDDIERILEATPAERQTVLFSATLPRRITQIADRHQREPERIRIAPERTADGEHPVTEKVYFVRRNDKPSALARILDVENPTAAIVFCRTRTEVDSLTETMNGRGYRAEALHGGMDQAQRDRVMARLRDGTAELLVATDVAARGLDVDTLTHVVNYNVPSAPESYVHRIGRVGRAGREGVAITLAEPRERRQVENIERTTRRPVPVGSVPSVADLREVQLRSTVDAVTAALASDDLDDYRSILHAFAGEDPTAVALAALKLVHDERTPEGEEYEIPDATQSKGRGKDRGRDRGRDGGRSGGRDDRSTGRGDRAERRGRDDGSRRPASGGGRGSGDGDTGFVYVSAGRKIGVRPGDLVGAIANESGVPGRQIGPIRISDHYSVVGVPEDQVDSVIRSMRSASVRGKPVQVRRFVTNDD